MFNIHWGTFDEPNMYLVHLERYQICFVLGVTSECQTRFEGWPKRWPHSHLVQNWASTDVGVCNKYEEMNPAKLRIYMHKTTR